MSAAALFAVTPASYRHASAGWHLMRRQVRYPHEMPACAGMTNNGAANVSMADPSSRPPYPSARFSRPPINAQNALPGFPHPAHREAI